MEWLLIPAFGVLIWLLQRSVQQEQALSTLAKRLKSTEELATYQAERAAKEVERLRTQVLELLKAHGQLQRRLGDIQEVVNAAPEPSHAQPIAPAVVVEQSPSVQRTPPPLLPSTTEPLVVEPPVAASMAPEAVETTRTLADAAFQAAASAGLTDSAASADTTDPATAPSRPSQPAPADTIDSEVAQSVPPAPAAIPTPPQPSNPAPPPAIVPPSAPTFDWEQLLGVRGAAWLGGIALAIAGTLFAKYSIENGLIGPTLRVILLTLLGLAALVGSEFFMRPRFAVTANAACGAGIAILYTAFYSAHGLYDLLPMAPTFGLMLLTTVVAALLSLRYDSLYIAVLGLVGGFATPLALSTGQDRPIGLFAYVLLLNFGFLWVAIQRRWHKLLSLSLAATLLIQTGWAIVHLSPEKLPILVATSTVFALLYISIPLFVKQFEPEKHQALLWNATSAAIWPFLFAIVLATRPEYAQRWALLFALVVCLDIGLLILAVERWALLLWPALFGSILTQVSWASTDADVSRLPVLAGVSLLLMVLFGLAPMVHRFRKPSQEIPESLHLTAAGASLWPLVAGLLLLGSDFGQRHGLLYGWLLVAYLWAAVTGTREGRVLRIIGVSTLLCLLGVQWTQRFVSANVLWPATLLLMVPVLIGNLLPRLAPHLCQKDVDPQKSGTRATLHELAATILIIGVVGLLGVQIAKGLAEPPWLLLLVVTIVFGLLGERSRVSALPLVQPVMTLLVAALLCGWQFGVFDSDADLVKVKPAERVLRDLAVPLLFAAAMQLRAAVRSLRGSAVAPALEDLGPGSREQMIWDSEVSATVATLVGMISAMLALIDSGLSQRPGLALLTLLAYNLLLITTMLRQTVTLLLLVGQLLSAIALISWQHDHFQAVDFPTVMPLYVVFYLWFLLLPLGLLLFVPRLRARRSLFFAAGLAGPMFFYPLYRAWLSGLGDLVIGALPVVMATLSLAGLAIVQALPRPGVTRKLSADEMAERHLAHRALFAAVGVGFIALAIPLQLQKQWIGVAWAIEAAAVWWMYRRLPHPGLKYFGLLLYCGVIFRLIPSAAFLQYHERGWPVVNWLLYSYGVPCICFLVGAAGLAPVEDKYRRRFEDTLPFGRLPLAGIAYYTGLVLIFVLINLEIADAFSVGRYTELWQERSYARDLTRSLSWVLYALTLLVTGMRQSGRGQRFFSLGLMLLTVGKVFLYDLAKVGGIYRALSFLGLAVSLFVVSLLYQRLAFRNAASGKDQNSKAPSPEKPT
jgi:uncharacterized membrane protein